MDMEFFLSDVGLVLHLSTVTESMLVSYYSPRTHFFVTDIEASHMPNTRSCCWLYGISNKLFLVVFGLAFEFWVSLLTTSFFSIFEEF